MKNLFLFLLLLLFTQFISADSTLNLTDLKKIQTDNLYFGNSSALGTWKAWPDGTKLSFQKFQAGGIIDLKATPQSGGTGYSVNDVLIISEGISGTATVTAVSSGVITSVTLLDKGRGYTVTAGLATTGGTGTGATLTVEQVGNFWYEKGFFDESFHSHHLKISDPISAKLHFEDTGESSDNKIMGIHYENKSLNIGSLLDDDTTWDKQNILSIHRDGNVGIGTNTPNYKLDVVGIINASGDLIIGTNVLFTDVSNGSVNLGSAVTGTDRFNVFSPTTGVQTGIASFYDSSSNIKFRIRDEWTASSIPPRIESHSSLGFAMNTTLDAPFVWYVNGTGNEKMRLTGTGLGIGISNPQNLLHIENNNTDANASQIVIEADSSSGAATYAALEFKANATSTSVNSAGRIKAFYTSPAFADATMIFQTITGGPAFVDTMSLKDGKVGIGTNTPGEKLEVAGNAKYTGFTQLGDVAPAIKMKKLTGTTAATEGSFTEVAHGLTISKIISFDVIVVADNGNLIPPEYSFVAEFQYSVFVTATNVRIDLSATDSSQLLSNSFIVVLTYEE